MITPAPPEGGQQETREALRAHASIAGYIREQYALRRVLCYGCGTQLQEGACPAVWVCACDTCKETPSDA